MWNTIKALANLKAYLVIFGVLLAGFVAQAYLKNVPTGLFESLRFVIITLLFVISFVRKKMSLWIFSAMVLGIEVGMDQDVPFLRRTKENPYQPQFLKPWH